MQTRHQNPTERFDNWVIQNKHRVCQITYREVQSGVGVTESGTTITETFGKLLEVYNFPSLNEGVVLFRAITKNDVNNVFLLIIQPYHDIPEIRLDVTIVLCPEGTSPGLRDRFNNRIHSHNGEIWAIAADNWTPLCRVNKGLVEWFPGIDFVSKRYPGNHKNTAKALADALVLNHPEFAGNISVLYEQGGSDEGALFAKDSSYSKASRAFNCLMGESIFCP